MFRSTWQSTGQSYEDPNEETVRGPKVSLNFQCQHEAVVVGQRKMRVFQMFTWWEIVFLILQGGWCNNECIPFAKRSSSLHYNAHIPSHLSLNHFSPFGVDSLKPSPLCPGEYGVLLAGVCSNTRRLILAYIDCDSHYYSILHVLTWLKVLL